MNSYLIDSLRSKFPDDVLAAHDFRGDETVTVRREALPAAAAFLRDELGFDLLMDLTAVDYLPKAPRYELVCHLYSTGHNYRLRLKCPVDGTEPSAPSLTPVWPGADWFEREVFDMFGIRFEGHPDLRRVLMYDGFKGHPLRKDYPLKGRQPRIAHKD